MSLSRSSKPYGTRELMRYARVRQPRIVDLRQRGAAWPALATLLARPLWQQQRWASLYRASGRMRVEPAGLLFAYFEHLTIEVLPTERLPSRRALHDAAAFAALHVERDDNYRADLQACIASVVAARLLKDPGALQQTSRLLAFVELFPRLHEVKTEHPYPPAVLDRWQSPRSRDPREAGAGGPAKDEARKAEAAEPTAAQLAADLHALAMLRARRMRLARAQLNRAAAGLTVEPARPPAKDEQRGEGRVRRWSERRNEIDALRLAEVHAASSDLGSLLVPPADGLQLPAAADDEAADWPQVQARVKAALKKHGWSTSLSACEALARLLQTADSATTAAPPAAHAADAGCTQALVQPAFNDDVRLLGHADLVRVEETFLRYTPGEIAYIENVLPGELRRRKLRSVKEFEQTTETVSEDSSETSSETASTSKLDLASQVETELSARLANDVNASANGSGGGKFGPVDFDGSAAVGANLSLGLDSRFASRNSSNFSQEIVAKALERIKRAGSERRLTRSTQRFETLQLHEIDNRGEGATARNGIYCFLDRHVCLTETVYGKRLFLLANLRLPGSGLLCLRREEIALGRQDLGHRPVFDITVDDVQPGTYKALATRFRAQNVQPPPEPLITLGRTYKTDMGNLNNEAPDFNLGKAAEVLTPFFQRYKRHVITDNVRLPEGYQVLEVMVTVSHGCNGISLPAHLPLKVAGAALGSGFTMTAAAAAMFGPALLVPLGLWQFEYAASPLAHYNSDSSNVTVTIGNQGLDSPYYFFDPAFLMRELFDLLGGFLADAPGLIDQLQQHATRLLAALRAKAEQVPVDVAELLQSTLDRVIENVRKVLESIRIGGDLQNGLYATFDALTLSLVDAGKLASSMGKLFDPLEDFIAAVIGLFRDGLQSAITEFFEFIADRTDNTQTLAFDGASGLRGELPVAINAVALRPGVTVNLVACLLRTEQALDRWRLQTFEALYQAYAQQLADHDSLAMLAGTGFAPRSPGTLRLEEARVVKERVMQVLNRLHGEAGDDGAAGEACSLERLQFFEHALDWRNLNLRLYNYGPGPGEALLAKDGVFTGADEARRLFLLAPWAQVMVPVQPDERLEGQVIRYIETGGFDFEAGFDADELTALYQELLAERALTDDDSRVTVLGTEVVPTDLLVLSDRLPENAASPCAPPP